MYLMSCITSDITYTINKLRYMSNSRVIHWKTIIKNFIYLLYTHSYKLNYTIYPVRVEGYSDVNWIYRMRDSKIY